MRRRVNESPLPGSVIHEGCCFRPPGWGLAIHRYLPTIPVTSGHACIDIDMRCDTALHLHGLRLLAANGRLPELLLLP